jgi:DNA mismatch endonuclease (patch repair protein)
MTDIFSKEQRSYVMSCIRSKDTKIEIMTRKALWALGFRYKKNCNKYPGKPDIVLTKYSTVIFIDSCFWHRCPKHWIEPKTNKEYWKKKFENNKKRDKYVNKKYYNMGWNVIRIWEHDIKKETIAMLAMQIGIELIKKLSSSYNFGSSSM